MRSIKETTTNTIIIKKSEFITTLIPCNDEKEIKDLIELYSKDDATHNCVAYRVGPLEKQMMMENHQVLQDFLC